MQYVDFGRTGLRVSRLGFGGIPVQRIDEPGTRAMLKAAHEAGINYIDTARAYTVSEEWIGQALEELGLRDEFILATKCRALTKAEMEAELAASLKNLRTDHIDLYQFHNPSPENLDKILAPGGAMEALMEAKAKGVKISCDLNYRGKLWTRAEARAAMTELCQYVDVCISN